MAGVLQNVIARYFVSGNPNVADVNSEFLVLIVPKTPTNQDNHNGGQVVFGPDGFLYAGFGDGGGVGDADNNAQNPASLLGKLVRMDVDSTPATGQTFVVPAGNPFAGTRAFPFSAIWADGLRNPWRFSFDLGSSTARLFLADVGQDSFEEVDLIIGGNNYGWHIREGMHCFSPLTGCPTAGLTDPIFEYDHSRLDEAITGGFVYRGTRIPQLVGTYVFGDFISGRIWGITQNAQGVWVRTDLLSLGANSVSSFGQDQQSEIYVVDLRGTVSHLHQVGTP